MSLNDALGQLALYESKSDFQKVCEVGAQLLRQPNAKFDISAFQQCVVTLIQNDQYQLALKTIQSLKTNESKKSVVPDANYLSFETLYVHYKLNHNQAFEETFQTIDLSTIQSPVVKRALLHLKAQQFYKLGYYNNAVAVYDVLINNDLSNLDDADLTVNSKAIASQQQLLAVEMSEPDNLMDEDPSEADSYDLLFNESLMQFNERHYTKALEFLSSAKDKAETYNANESLLDVFLEVAPMYLQTSYIHGILNAKEEALRVLQEFHAKFESVLSHPDAKLFRLIYLNNYYSLVSNKGDESIILNNFGFTEAISALNKDNKFLKFQYYLLKRNEAIFNFKIGKKVSITKELNYDTSSASTDFKRILDTKVIDDNENYDLTILGLACLQESGIAILDDLNVDEESKWQRVPKQFYNYLVSQVAKINSDSISLTKAKKLIAGTLLSIQLLVNHSTDANLNSHLNNGIQLLEKLLAIPKTQQILLASYFGIITLLVSLYQLTYNQTSYLTKFQKLYDIVYENYSSFEITNKFQYNFLKKLNFEFFNINVNNPDEVTRSTNNKKIISVFDTLLAFQPNDKLVGILKAELTNEQQQEDTESLLIPVEELTSELDFTQITTEGLNKVLAEYASGAGSAAAAQIFKKKAKRVRKIPQHPSKAAAEGKPLDQERWLPMKDRTYYKVSKKDKKKMKQATQGAQGGSADHTTEESGITGGGDNRVGTSSGGSKKNKKKKGGKRK
ncbi:signal recognition particle subunit [Saccharomycopsis crataegensis]|uniref:Signal recognition particle subunit SRP72 n=1 Tax=Saccharomycopsis crataegensis TaxID=43959 RepID=A0AAV5QF52_9ASCO|nr:signal recognition particle subunit [Saccharomycopsis crataegensis]